MGKIRPLVISIDDGEIVHLRGNAAVADHQLCVAPMKNLAKEPSKQEVARRLRLAREVIGLNQGDFADGAGIKHNTYNQYETGKKRLSLQSALALREAYDLTLDWIYCGDPSNLRYEFASAIKSLLKARVDRRT